jgi:hypothetical protein
LPFALRNELNERIRDGATGAALVSWMNAHPDCKRILRDDKSGPLNAQNLTDWRGSGYKDWLADQAQAERIRAMAEVSNSIMAASGCDPSTIGARIAAASLMEVASNPDDPEQLMKAAGAIASLRITELNAERNALSRSKQGMDAERLALDRKKFDRDTCELFIKWAKSHIVQDIVNGKGSHEDKVAALLDYMRREVTS